MSSRPLAGLSVARTRTGLEGEDALGTRFEGAALERDQATDAPLGDRQERVEPGAAEGHLLGCPAPRRTPVMTTFMSTSALEPST